MDKLQFLVLICIMSVCPRLSALTDNNFTVAYLHTKSQLTAGQGQACLKNSDHYITFQTAQRSDKHTGQDCFALLLMLHFKFPDVQQAVKSVSC